MAHKGFHHTEETKEKIRLNAKTNPNFGTKGKKYSETSKRKMRIAQGGKNNPMYGKKNKWGHHTKKTKEKMSKSLKGRISPRKGAILSKELKDKISAGTKAGMTLEIKKRMSKNMKGKRCGKDNNLWRGGITPIKDAIRCSDRYKIWRQQVFIRDNFICQECGEKGGHLEAHHNDKAFVQLLHEVAINLPLFDLYSGAMIYEPMWDINNGKTLCVKCHRDITFGRRK